MKQAAGFLVAGAMVGAAIALLYAPQSGVRTKKDIKKFARKTVHGLDDFQEDMRDKVADWVDEMSQIVTDGADRGKKLGAEGYQQVLQAFDNVLQAFDSAKKYVEDGRSRIEQLIKTV
jgi:gas vesicle protein